MRKLKLKLKIFALMAALLIAAPSGASASELDADGLAADSLTITVGYFGGPYYEKHVFTLDELWAMDVQYMDYTFIDNMPSVVISHVAGVTLADVLAAAGIDIGSVQSFNFWTNDKSGGYYTSLTKTALIDTPRYCYYSLPDNFDYDTGKGSEYATADGVRVPAMIALADDWRRALAGASFGSDYTNLDTSVRFRLVYGQIDASTRTASDSAKWIHAIEVTLGGAPTLSADVSVLDLTVGSKFRSEPCINAADPIIAENAVIEWTSSDASIASVDAEGEITMHSEGTAVITGRYGGSEVSIAVTGTKEPEEETPGMGRTGSPESAEYIPPQDNHDTLSITPAEAPVKIVIGQEISILDASIERSDDEGGVQNWRRDALAEGAVELPVIAEDNPAIVPLCVAVIVLFAGSIAARLTIYYMEIKENPDVINGKSN